METILVTWETLDSLCQLMMLFQLMLSRTIEGRADDWFCYAHNIQVHPMTFRHVLGQNPNIIEYQVEQTQNGAIIRVVAPKNINRENLQKSLISSLFEPS